MKFQKMIYFFLFFSAIITSFESYSSFTSRFSRYFTGKKSSKRFYKTSGSKKSNYWHNFKNWFQKPQTKKNVASGAKAMVATSAGLVAFYKFKNWLYDREKDIMRPISIKPREMTIDTSKLWQAIYGNDFDAVIKAINSGADINSQSSGNWTPLFAAISRENIDIVKLLIEKGADLHYKMPEFENNALFIASEHNNKEIIALLLEKGLDINQKNSSGETPLFWAMPTLWLDQKRKNIEIVKFLIKNGANVNIENNSGDSVLSQICHDPYGIAQDPNKLALIKVLLEAGADWNKESVLRAAEKEDRILNVLEEHLSKKHHSIN